MMRLNRLVVAAVDLQASHGGNVKPLCQWLCQGHGYSQSILDLPTVGRWKVKSFPNQLEFLMITFEVKDMTCGHCVSTITKAVRSVDKDATVQIELQSRRVQIEPTEATADELRDAIQEAGYTPVAVSNGSLKPEVAKRSGCCCG